jgi:hypothetical protein
LSSLSGRNPKVKLDLSMLRWLFRLSWLSVKWRSDVLR